MESPGQRIRHLRCRMDITMNAKKIIIIAAAALLAISACGTRGGKKTATAAEAETYFTAIDKYLTEVIGTQYSPAEICIPFHDFISVDENNNEDIEVWGNFWVDNYNVIGDTLMFVSGGNHAGKMHVKKDSEGHFTVTGFDEVGDGSTFLPSAKAIFGEKFDAFQKASSNQEKREEIRKTAIASYVSRHQLPVKVYKDYGWPAVEIPQSR